MYKRENRKAADSSFFEMTCAFLMISRRKDWEKIWKIEQKDFCNIIEKVLKKEKKRK